MRAKRRKEKIEVRIMPSLLKFFMVGFGRFRWWVLEVFRSVFGEWVLV